MLIDWLKLLNSSNTLIEELWLTS